MSDAMERSYPPGVEHRRKRPHPLAAVGGLTGLGAAVGLAMSENLAGALVGAIIGAALTPEEPSQAQLPLKEAVEQALRNNNATLIAFYRRGPYRAEALFSYKEQFWTIASEAPFHDQWTQDALDDWLYGDLVDHQLPAKLRQIQFGSLG